MVVKLTLLESGTKKALENPGAEELLKEMGGEHAGMPFYVFLDKAGTKIADSLAMPGGENIGYPGSAGEIAAFQGLLEQTATRMTSTERARIGAYLSKGASMQLPRQPAGKIAVLKQSNVVLGLVNLGCAFLFIVVSLPLLKRKVKMNHFYGIRIPKAFESEENWYDINAYGAKQFISGSWVIGLAGIFCFFIPLDNLQNPVLLLLWGVGPIILVSTLVLVKTLSHARKL